MKKIIAIVTALLLLTNLFTFSAFANSLNIISVHDGGNTTQYSVGEVVTITGTCTPGKDLVLRLYNEKQGLIYTDIILAPDNTSGDFKFTGFKIPPTASIGVLTYKVIVSETEGATNSVDLKEMPLYVNVPESNKSIGGGGGGGGTTEITMTSWVHHEKDEVEDQKEVPPHKDPLNPDNDNDELWNKVNKVTNTTEAGKTIGSITKATSKEDLKGETARNNVATAGEVMVANIGAIKLKTNASNVLMLDSRAITANDISKLNKTMAAVEKSIEDNDITLNRTMSKQLAVNVSFKEGSKATISITKDVVDRLESANVDSLTVNDSDFVMSYSVADLREMLGDNKETSFEFDKSQISEDTKKIAVNFDTDKTKTVKIAFPGLDEDSKYMAIVDENGNPVGGRYNPATGNIEAKISEAGVYEVVNNEKNFSDIKHLSEDVQESIKILAAKGIIEGTSATEFSPDSPINRAEIAALLLRVLSQLDPNADGGFEDVKKSDWFFGTAGSAKAYGMIVGYEDNTFRGTTTIAKDQILTISSRVLKKEMKYIAPENPAEWLTFTDASSIADWAVNDIALATMANIITRNADNTIRASEDMTRGDAALIIMRLFYKIW